MREPVSRARMRHARTVEACVGRARQVSALQIQTVALAITCVRAATGVATLCPEMDPGEPASMRWLALIESMVAVNGEITALETVLRAVLDANREEVAAARAGAVREPSS